MFFFFTFVFFVCLLFGVLALVVSVHVAHESPKEFLFLALVGCALVSGATRLAVYIDEQDTLRSSTTIAVERDLH